MSTAVGGVLPFIAAYLMLLALFIAFPSIVTIPMAFLIG
jgi:hypothetical protein